MLTETLNNHIQESKTSICLAFIDGEIAFTRPPRELILEALCHSGVRGTHWFMVDAMLGKLHGCLSLGRRLHGRWSIFCSVPQGGALSVCLFVILLAQLYQSQVEAGCGIHVRQSDGTWKLLRMLAFIDDLVLLATSPPMLQKAIDITMAWANRIRIRVNIGPGKSATMIWGKGNTPNQWHKWVFYAGAKRLPRVSVYKHLRVHISSGNSASHHVKHMAAKSKTNTLEIDAWSRTHNVAQRGTTHHLLRLATVRTQSCNVRCGPLLPHTVCYRGSRQGPAPVWQAPPWSV